MFLFLEPISPYIVGMSVSCEFIAKCVRARGRPTDRQTDRQTDRPTGRQADMQTGRQADREYRNVRSCQIIQQMTACHHLTVVVGRGSGERGRGHSTKASDASQCQQCLHYVSECIASVRELGESVVW